MRASLFVFATILLLVGLAWFALRLWQMLMRPGAVFTTVYDWQHALLYVDGRFERILPPGRYPNFSGLTRRDIYTLRRSEQLETIPQVDVTSADKFVFRISATLTYQVIDPREAFENAHLEKLRLAASSALVALASERTLEAFLSERAALNEQLLARMVSPICGCEIKSVTIVAVILPPEVRRLLTEVERAKLEGQASLERARGEQAALRSLANAARMLKGNPELMNLRMLQVMSGTSGKAQPTLVLGQGALLPISRDSPPSHNEA
jgi:regulator of protease activity HflC (stomatin/prohibitin superfamily)